MNHEDKQSQAFSCHGFLSEWDEIYELSPCINVRCLHKNSGVPEALFIPSIGPKLATFYSKDNNNCL